MIILKDYGGFRHDIMQYLSQCGLREAWDYSFYYSGSRGGWMVRCYNKEYETLLSLRFEPK